jgi:hypothetical protein
MSRSRCLIAVPAIALLSVTTAQAQQPAPARSVAAVGAASVKVKAPSDRKHEAPIRAAVEAAEAKALPRAIAEARSKAAELARLSGLTLGAVVSVSDAPTSPYGPYFGFYGTFGPDRFCGTIRTSVFKARQERQAQACRPADTPHLPRAADGHVDGDGDVRGAMKVSRIR